MHGTAALRQAPVAGPVRDREAGLVSAVGCGTIGGKNRERQTVMSARHCLRICLDARDFQFCPAPRQ